MIDSKKNILLFILCFVTLFSIAQQIKNESGGDKYRAVHWDLEDGLSQSLITNMLKDVNGFLWIGTHNGLNRFDGNIFKIYFHDPQNTGTIPDNNITGLIEDSLHNIWVGTDRGLSRYDIKADTFSNFLPSQFGYTITPFQATGDKVYCIEGGYMITEYNIHSFAKKPLMKLPPVDYWGLEYSVFDAATNSVWVFEGCSGSWEGGLLQISLSTGRTNHYDWACYKKIYNHCHWSEAMCYDHKRNSIWINSPDGLIQFTLDDKKFHAIAAIDALVNSKDYDRWVGIDLDRESRICFATTKGIIIYDPDDQSVKLPFAENPAIQKTVSESNVCIYCDRDGIIWSGFWDTKGIYQLTPFSQSAERFIADASKLYSLSSNLVYNCINADKDRLWIGTRDGLNIFDPRNGSFEVLREKDMPGIKGNEIIPVNMDTAMKKAWLYTGSGFFEMDISSKKCRPLIFKNIANQVIPHVEDQAGEAFRNISAFKKGCIISASDGDNHGIFIVNSDSAVAHEVLSFPAGEIRWFGTYTGDDDHLLFLNRPDSASNLTYENVRNKWMRIKTPLDSIKWERIYYNLQDQTYWVVIFQQLLRYNKDFRVMKRYTKEDGLPGIDILNLIADNKGNIWFNTDRAIYQLNIKTGTITMLSEKDGFQKQRFFIYPRKLVKDVFGDLYFACGFYGQGFDRISPDKFISTASSVYLQSLEINQKLFPLSTGVNNLQELSLHYFENKITIETGIIDYYSKGSSRIRYKLEVDGKNTDWQYAPDYYTIRYENLSPAKYRLVMQSSNAANEFNGPEKILTINISRAFWNTWWFRLFALAFLIDLIYSFIRWRLKQKYKLKLERSEKERQIADIKQKSTELEMQALRAQMNPHFIFNSLNSINRFILQNDRAQASGYLTKFSRLVRMILQNSQASLISLESELESLNLYLDLEAVRFEHRFTYKISYPKDLDIEVLKVPPLIIQPFTENAIWHGLMHKEDKGQLDIDVSMENDYLYIKITDNGIGRKKAAELASKSATKHKSMGLRITKDRIAMLQKSNSEESPVRINDLVNPDGTAAGTQVVIKMPVIEEV